MKRHSPMNCDELPRVVGTCPGRPRGGFSLLELMIVLVIIGMLAGLITTNVRGRLVLAKQNVAKFDVATIVDAVETFYTVAGRYPTTEEGLEVLTVAGEGASEPLLERVPKDPWGHAYEYLSPGRDRPYEVISLGGDGRAGGKGAESDIVSWQLRKQ